MRDFTRLAIHAILLVESAKAAVVALPVVLPFPLSIFEDALTAPEVEAGALSPATAASNILGLIVTLLVAS